MASAAAAALQPSHAPTRRTGSRHFRSVFAVATAQAPPKAPPARSRALQDPAKLEGSQSASVQVLDAGGDISLDRYMQLPTEQYSELDPQMIKALGGSSFLLKVPRLTLFSVWVEPEVVVTVKLDEGAPGVVFESGECRLHGSDLLKQLKLDERFVLYFHTLLRWEPGSPSRPAADIRNGSPQGGMGAINAQTTVQVWSEVVGPFRAIPRPVLQATGNAVLGALMQALLPIFMKKLADDYRRWSMDAAYRARRAGVSAAPRP